MATSTFYRNETIRELRTRIGARLYQATQAETDAFVARYSDNSEHLLRDAMTAHDIAVRATKRIMRHAGANASGLMVADGGSEHELAAEGAPYLPMLDRAFVAALAMAATNSDELLDMALPEFIDRAGLTA